MGKFFFKLRDESKFKNKIRKCEFMCLTYIVSFKTMSHVFQERNMSTAESQTQKVGFSIK